MMTRRFQPFYSFFHKKLIPCLVKINNEKHFAAIFDTFSTLLPLFIGGGILMTCGLFIFGYHTHQVSLLGIIAKCYFHTWNWKVPHHFEWPSPTYNHISQVGGLLFTYVYQATLGATSLLVVLVLPYFLSQAWERNHHSVLAGNLRNNPAIEVDRHFQIYRLLWWRSIIPLLLSMASFAILTMGKIQFFLGANGLLVSLISTILAVDLFYCVQFGFHKWYKRQTDLTSDGQGILYFAFSLPVIIITLFLIALLNCLVLLPALLVTGWQVLSFSNVNDPTVWNNSVSLNGFLLWLHNHYPHYHFQDLSNNYAQLHALLRKWGNTTFNFKTFHTLLAQLQHNLSQQGFYWFVHYLFYQTYYGVMPCHYWNGHIHFFVTHGGVTLQLQSRLLLIDNTHFGFAAGIYQGVTFYINRFANSSASLGLAVIYVICSSFLSWIGVSGKHLLTAVFGTIWLTTLQQNAHQILQLHAHNFTTNNVRLAWLAWPVFEAYIFLGGAGATLALNLIQVVFCYNRGHRSCSRRNLVSSLFNLEAPTIYSQKLILNWVYCVPFLLAPLVNLFLVYFFIAKIRLVNVSYLMVGEFMPVMLSGLISSGWDLMSLILSCASLVASIIIYVPFVILDNVVFLHLVEYEDPALFYEIKQKIADHKIGKHKAQLAKIKMGKKCYRITKKLQKIYDDLDRI